MRSTRSRAFAVVVFVVLLALPSARVSGANFDAVLSDAMRLRRELGFNADPTYVAELLRAGPISKFGDAITPAEEKELARREGVRAQLKPAIDLVLNNPDDFGGIYFDQSVGDMLLVIRTLPNTRAALQQQVSALFPPGAVVDFRPALHSQHTLEKLRDSLFFALPRDTATTAWVDPETNRVGMTVPAGDLDHARALAAPNADAVTISVGGPLVGAACVSRQSCEIPWRGGTVLGPCTWGFNARPTVASTVRYAVSAGHCANLGALLQHDANVVTTAVGVDRDTYDLPVASSESLRAPLKTDAGARNLIYISSANMAYAITSKETTANQLKGVGIAQSGVVSLYVSGTINRVGMLGTVCRGSDCYTANLIQATFNAQHGDSGAPVISRTLPKAFGVIYGFQLGDPRALYTAIDRVGADLQLRLCLDAACN